MITFPVFHEIGIFIAVPVATAGARAGANHVGQTCGADTKTRKPSFKKCYKNVSFYGNRMQMAPLPFPIDDHFRTSSIDWL